MVVGVFGGNWDLVAESSPPYVVYRLCRIVWPYIVVRFGCLVPGLTLSDRYHDPTRRGAFVLQTSETKIWRPERYIAGTDAI